MELLKEKYLLEYFISEDLVTMTQNQFNVINTQYGPVKGVRTSTALGRTIYDFQTIPYMKPPTGKLRFRDAQPPELWTEPYDATIKRPSYLTSDFQTTNLSGQEDAGIVSISTPYLDRKLPVAGKLIYE